MVQSLTGKWALHFNQEFPIPQCWEKSLKGNNKTPSFTVSFKSPSGMFACGTLGTFYKHVNFFKNKQKKANIESFSGALISSFHCYATRKERNI